MSGTAPGVDGDLGGHLDLGGLEAVQVGAEHAHDLRGQVSPRFAAHGLSGDVLSTKMIMVTVRRKSIWALLLET
jgi:hypothetical protein